MHSPALAFAWELRQRHRWGFLTVLAYFAVLAVLRPEPFSFDDAETFALFVAVPLAALFFYFLAVFSFGLSGDIAARQSMYPPRMFTLPVTTAALAGWPMLYGAIAMAVLWLATRFLGAWPADVHVPVFWPALLGPALVAWTQALTWMPYPLRGLRVIVTVLWLMVIDMVMLVALELKAPESVMIAILAPQVPLAYFVARFAVGKARCSAGLRPASQRPASGRHYTFRSASHAQTWLEWRQHGRSLPALVAILLPFQLAMLYLFREVPVIVFETLVLTLLTPPFMAIFVAATVSKGITPFLATRPMSNASLIAAKLKVTFVSTLITWLLVAVVVPIALKVFGTMPMVTEAAQRLVEFVGMPRAIALALLALAALIASTWKQLVQSLCIGMSGREWLVKGSVFAALTLLAIGLLLVKWVIDNRKVIAALYGAGPWILAALVGLKVVAGSWTAARLQDRRLLSHRALLTGAAAWCASALALYALLVWIAPELIVRSYTLGLVAILMIPLARLAAAPLALDWNRHR